MNDRLAVQISDPTDVTDDARPAALKTWHTPAIISGELADAQNSANTVSDGTGNLFS